MKPWRQRREVEAMETEKEEREPLLEDGQNIAMEKDNLNVPETAEDLEVNSVNSPRSHLTRIWKLILLILRGVI